MCERVTLPGGGVAIVCGRGQHRNGRKAPPRCHACPAPATVLCDAPGCDRPCCPAHHWRSSRRESLPGDFCPDHAAEPLLAALRARGFAVELGAGAEAGRLLVTPGSSLTEADKTAIRGYKEDLLRLLGGEKAIPAADPIPAIPAAAAPPPPAPAVLTDDDLALVGRLVRAERPPLTKLAEFARQWNGWAWAAWEKRGAAAGRD